MGDPKFDAGRTERAGVVQLGPITVAASAGKYYVEIREGTMFSCTCPDFTMRLKEQEPCKHVLALVQVVGNRLVRWGEILGKVGNLGGK